MNTRVVRTAKGAKRYHVPIGDPIPHAKVKPPEERLGRGRRVRSVRKLTAAEQKRATYAIGGFSGHRFGSHEEAAKFTAGQRKRISPEAVAEFSDIARGLRTGHGHERADKIDAAMEPLDRDLVLTRHLPATAFGKRDLAELVGRKIADKAYTPAALHQGPQDGGITLHISAPKGTRALVAGDNEVWLDRNVQLAVQAVVPNDHGGHDVHVTVLPKAPTRGPRTPKSATPQPHAVEVRPETHALVQDAARALPQSEDDWKALTQRVNPDSPKRRIDKYLRDDEAKLEDLKARRDLTKMALEESRADWKQLIVQRGYGPRTKKHKEMLSEKLAPLQKRLEEDEDAVRAQQYTVQNYRDLLADPDRLGNGSSTHQWLSEEIPPEVTYLSPLDASGIRRVPPPALKEHHDRVVAVGKAIHEDLQRAFENDAQLAGLEQAATTANERFIQANKDFDEASKGRGYFGVDESVRDALRTARQERKDALREVARRRKELVQDALRQIRPFGGASHSDVKAATPDEVAKMLGHKAAGSDMAPEIARTDWRDQLRVGEQHFPDDWVNTSSERPMDVVSSRRAYHSEHQGTRPGATVLAMNTDEGSGKESYDGGFDSVISEITVHEMGHRMEQVIPGLRALEFAYVRSKTTDASGRVEPAQKLNDIAGGGYMDYETAFKDEFPEPYTGKTYESRNTDDPSRVSWEAFQVGLQDVYGHGSRRYGDDSLQHFVLGVLATLGWKEESWAGASKATTAPTWNGPGTAGALTPAVTPTSEAP